jgi:hypothetical protein
MPDPADRQNADPGAIRKVLAYHAHELAPYMMAPAALDPPGTDPAAARRLAEQAALYAMAAFDPQDAVDAMLVRSILMTNHMALDPRGTDALSRYLRATVTIVLRSLEQRQVRMRMRDEPPIPGRRRKTPKQREMPPVVPLPEGVAHWLDLVTDPELRRRLDVR